MVFNTYYMKNRFSLFTILFLSLIIKTQICSAFYTVESVPNPKVATNSYVSDPDHFLQQETISEINTLLSTLEQKTTDQVAVVVLNSIGEEDHEDFANKL